MRCHCVWGGWPSVVGTAAVAQERQGARSKKPGKAGPACPYPADAQAPTLHMRSSGPAPLAALTQAGQAATCTPGRQYRQYRQHPP